MTRARHQAGQATVEFAGTIGLLLLAALFAWQLALAGWTVVQVANTARTVARLYSREGSELHAHDEGMRSLQGDGLGNKATVSFDGSRWSVTAYMPILLPGLPSGLAVTRTATMPRTG